MPDWHDCQLIVAHGERLAGHALGPADARAARPHAETALMDGDGPGCVLASAAHTLDEQPAV
jgi:hypothetical protein